VSPPNLHVTVSGNLLAWYGAIVATLTALVQLSNHFRDRAKVVLKALKNMQRIGDRSDTTMTIITATNVGRRPVTIRGFAARLLFSEQGHSDWILPDVRPTLPYEITEGREVSAFLNENKADLSSVAYWYAWDGMGREYRLNVASPYKRWISHWRWRRKANSSTKPANSPSKQPMGSG
jgi:hypothetical protein